METRVYSSELVQALIENTKWNFWKKDWSKRIIVLWNPAEVPIERFAPQVRKILGAGFLYERAINSMEIEYEVIGNKKEASLQTY